MSYITVGDDGADMMIGTPMSAEGTEYEIHIERSSGRLYCSCPSSVMGKRIGHLLHPEDGCKHIRAYHRHIAREVEQTR